MNAAAAELGRGAYPLRVAARLAHMRPVTARRGIEGIATNGTGRTAAPKAFPTCGWTSRPVCDPSLAPAPGARSLYSTSSSS